MTPATGVTIRGYSHVAVPCIDVDATRDFYRDHFGFEELPRPDFGFPGLWLRVGDLQLHFVQVGADELHGPKPGFPHFALHVPTDAFAATVDALRAAGVQFLGAPSSRVDFGVDVQAAFVADPSGNVIELTDVGPLPAASG